MRNQSYIKKVPLGSGGSRLNRRGPISTKRCIPLGSEGPVPKGLLYIISERFLLYTK